MIPGLTYSSTLDYFNPINQWATQVTASPSKTGGTGVTAGGGGFIKQTYKYKGNSASYTKSDDTIHILGYSILVYSRADFGDLYDNTGADSIIRIQTGRQVAPVLPATDARTAYFRLETVDRGGLINEKILCGETDPWNISQLAAGNIVNNLLLNESYSSQNPLDFANENTRAYFRIPLTMKMYPRAFVWRLLNDNNQPIQWYHDPHEVDSQVFRGGVFVDRTQKTNC